MLGVGLDVSDSQGWAWHDGQRDMGVPVTEETRGWLWGHNPDRLEPHASDMGRYPPYAEQMKCANKK